MKAFLILAVLFMSSLLPAFAMEHGMQHGFILTIHDTHASHLVAEGHHSRQVNVSGQLKISDVGEQKLYEQRKRLNEAQETSYFLFQAQDLDLPAVKEGDVLRGHIIESKIGQYEPGNKIVSDAQFVVDKVFLNLVNPFFQ
jgi:hypothetical protein